MITDTALTLGSGVATIGSQAFANCTSLTTLTIPVSVGTIGYRVFGDCSNLTSITYSGTIEQWNSVTKDSSWNDDSSIDVIHCTDGDLYLSAPSVELDF